MRFLILGYLGVSVVASIQQQQMPLPVVEPACGEFSFEGRVNGSDEYASALGEGLRFRLVATGKNAGWMIEVQPLDGMDDYAYPVNPPYRSDNSQWLQAGYGDTLDSQLKSEHEVFFVSSREEFRRAAKLLEDEFSSTDSESAGKFLAILPTLRSAVLKLKPVKYQISNGGGGVNWMQFTVTVTTPASFRPAPGLKATRVACPSKSP